MIFRKEVLKEKLLEMNRNPPKRNYLTDANFRVISALVEITDENGRVALTKAVALFPDKDEKAAMNKIRQACHHFNKGAKRGGFLFRVRSSGGTRTPLNTRYLEFYDIDALVEDFTRAEIGEVGVYVNQPVLVFNIKGDDTSSA